MMIEAEVLHSPTCQKEETQTALHTLSLKPEGETNKQTKKHYPNNVSGNYVCLHIGYFMALNISVGSYIKQSLHSGLPLILSASFSKSKCTSTHQNLGSTLIRNQNANRVAFSSTFCTYATVLYDNYHASDMIL